MSGISNRRCVIDASDARNSGTWANHTACSHRNARTVLPRRTTQDKRPRSGRTRLRYAHARREHQTLTEGRVAAHGIDTLHQRVMLRTRVRDVVDHDRGSASAEALLKDRMIAAEMPNRLEVFTAHLTGSLGSTASHDAVGALSAVLSCES